MWTYIVRTDNAKLRLKVLAPLSEGEWNTLITSLRALEPAVVSEEPPMTQEEEEEQIARLTALAEPQGAPSHDAPSLWVMKKRPTPEQILGRQTFMGPLDSSHMGLRLRVGDKAVLTPAHENVHADAMHRWVEEFVGSPNYVCSHGGCWATVEVTTA